MAVKRYLFLGNGERLDRIVSRYVAMDHPANDARMSGAELAAMQRHRARAQEQDLLAPSEWCWTDADAAELSADNPALWRPSAQTTAFLGRNLTKVDRFLHFCDMDLARAWLDIAQRLVASDSAIDRLPRERQFEVCRDAWMSLGNVFRALNVRPYGWQKYRYQWEWAARAGYVAPQSDADRERGFYDPSSATWAPRPLNAAPQFFPNTATAVDPGGAWRVSMMDWYNRDNPNQRITSTDNVVIGLKADVDVAAANLLASGYDRNGAGCFSDLRVTSSNCFTASPGVFYVWMGNDGVIAGNRMPAAGIRTWRSASWSYVTLNVYPPTLYATVPFKWYIDMLRTILRDIASRDFFSLIHEIRLDVIGKNLWDSDRLRLGGAEPLAEMMIVSAHDRQMSEGRRVTSLIVSAITLTAPLPGVGAIAGAIVGLFVSVVTVLNELTGGGLSADNPADYTSFARDIFGRILPTLEIFQMDSSARMGADVSYITNVLPPPPPGYTPPTLFVAPVILPTQTPSVAPARQQGVIVLGIPPFSVVFVGDSPNGNVGSAVVGTPEAPLWFTPTPTGEVSIRVLAPDQSIRTARVNITQDRIASVPFSSMEVVRPASTTNGRLTVRGQPGWRIALAMDGTTTPFVAVALPASGESVSEWPAGSYMIGVDDGQGHVAAKRITLSSAPTVVDAAALLTSSAQQRQTAEGGSKVGWWVAGAVGAGALAIFLATMMLDGKPAPKRNPRR